jgi:hypothetical protein
VVLGRDREYLSQAKITLKISEFIQNRVFNMISEISCNVTATHRDMHKRRFMGRGRVALALADGLIPRPEINPICIGYRNSTDGNQDE